MNIIENDTKYILRKYGIVANKRLGQNFLINEDVINKIIEKSEVTKEDLIIEIGPGLGTLTEYLLKVAGKVVCVELDPKMIYVLSDRFKECSNIEIINEDILRVDLERIINNNKEFKHVRVIANLPYYITTPIIMKLLENKLNIDTITIMIQKEVAERIVADPGGKDYGVLSLSVKYYADSEIVVYVPSVDFLPEPSVDSAVVLLRIHNGKKYKVRDEKVLFGVIKGGFSQRRKLFANAIESYLKIYNISKDEFVKILNNHGIQEYQRAETLSLEQYIEIADDITYLKILRE